MFIPGKALSILAWACQAALIGAIVAPLVWAGVALVFPPGFPTDEMYWWASVVGAILGGMASAARRASLARPEDPKRAGALILGGLLGVAAVLVLGIPCSGLGGAAVGILIWAIQAEFLPEPK